MYKHIYNHVKKYISPTQHGFTDGRSTTTNLLSFWNYVTDSIEEGYQVDAIYTDFSKAFDTVNHVYLVHKLSKLGIHGCILKWCESYLTDRSFKVVHNGYSSHRLQVSSGVPQGSALGPLFFLIFINDLAETLTMHCIPHLFYADDLKIYLKIRDESDCQRLQLALNLVSNWCERWDLKLNKLKCQMITFHSYRKLNTYPFTYQLENTPLKRVAVVDDLGVTMQSNCLFNLHITKIVNKAFKLCGFLKRSLYFVKDAKTIITIYNAIVRSLLCYACIVWNPSQQFLISEIERVQRNLIRYICYKTGVNRDSYSYEELCQKFQIPTLYQFRLSLSLNFFYHLIHSKINCSELLKYVSLLIPQVATRNRAIFGIPKPRTDYMRRAWHYFLPNYCNHKNINPFVSFTSWKRSIQESW
jgi:hypothetical protein